MWAARAGRGPRGPAVGVVGAVRNQHPRDGDDQAGPQFETLAAAAFVGHVRSLVHRPGRADDETNKSCASQTVHNLVHDYNDGALAAPVRKPAELDKLVRSRQPDVVDVAG